MGDYLNTIDFKSSAVITPRPTDLVNLSSFNNQNQKEEEEKTNELVKDLTDPLEEIVSGRLSPTETILTDFQKGTFN
jgi:NADPH-dependent 7-cyano-7-deazaguanine reductase QueF-like protein